MFARHGPIFTPKFPILETISLRMVTQLTYLINSLNSLWTKKFSTSTIPLTVNKDVKYIKLPYMGPISFEMRKSLNKILKSCYPQIKFHFAFKNTNTIGNFLKRKEKRF